jgi:hypothetical protein
MFHLVSKSGFESLRRSNLVQSPFSLFGKGLCIFLSVAVFRGGGIEKVSVVSGGMFGLDGRLGVQWSDLLGFYVQPHLSFGSLSGEAGGVGVTGGTGTFSVAAMAEATLVDRFFFGAGFGYGILNNPSGPMLQARAGGYLLTSRAEDGIRRKGLMAGVDLRTIFIEGATGVLVIASIGYEKY